MELNTEILEALKLVKVPENQGVPYLLALRYGYKSSPLFSSKLVQTMNQSGIYDVISNSRGTRIEWLIPLFKQEAENNYDWVKKFVKKFADANPEREGNLNTCIIRMKEFLFSHPDVTKRDVQKATELYFNTLSDVRHTTTSHYFIYKGKGKDRVSLLEEYVMRVKELESLGEGRSSLSNTMQ